MTKESKKYIVSSCHNTATSTVHIIRTYEPILICKMCGNKCELHEVPIEYVYQGKYKRHIVTTGYDELNKDVDSINRSVNSLIKKDNYLKRNNK